MNKYKSLAKYVATLILIISLMIITFPSPALALEPPEEEWSKTFGGTSDDLGYSVQQTSDGGYIIVGNTASYGTVGQTLFYGAGNDVWLIKTDSYGNKLWDKTFGGTEGDWGHSVQQTSDGGYIIAGYTFSYGAGECDVWLIRTDSGGNKLWDRTFGGEAHYPGWIVHDEGHSVQQTSDGGYIIAGEIEHPWPAHPGFADRQVWLIKTDSSGSKLWDKIFGGTGDDFGRSVQQTSDGGYIIAGEIEHYGTTDSDVWLIKTDSGGNKLWDKTFGGTDRDVGHSVQQTSDGGYIITGFTSSYEAGSYDVWLIKTDSSGNKLWDKTFGATGRDMGYSVQQTSDGGYIIAGDTCYYGPGWGDVWLIKTDSYGNKLWDKTFGGTGRGHSVQQTSDGGYIIAGFKLSYGAGWDVWLIKVSATEEAGVLPGDANGDGVVNNLDITKVERIIVGLDAETPGADANQDGVVNNLDITKVERIIVGLD